MGTVRSGELMSKVHRHLDAPLKILGFEAPDLLGVLLFASIMNVIFGQTALSALMVFVFPFLFGCILYWSKRNKPEKFLIHFIRYHFQPGFYEAGHTLEIPCSIIQ